MFSRIIKYVLMAAMLGTGVYGSEKRDFDSFLNRIMISMDEGVRLKAIRTDVTLDSAIVFFETARGETSEGIEMTASQQRYLDSINISALTRIGDCYYWKEDYTLALNVLSIALNEWKTAFGNAHPNAGNTTRMLADTHRRIGKLSEAEALYLEAIEILEPVATSTPANGKRFAKALQQLGWLYQVQSRYYDAEASWSKEKDFWEKQFGPEHLGVHDCLANLFQSYIHSGRYAEAEKTARRQYELAERLIDSTAESKLRVAGAANSLGRLYIIQGLYEQGESFLRESMRLRIDASGPETRYAASGLGNLGWCYLVQKKYDQAEDYLSRAIIVYEELDSQDKVTTVARGLFLSYMGNLCRQKARYRESMEYYQRAVDVLEESVGDYHTSLILPLTGLAYLHLRDEDFDEAKRLIGRSVDIQGELFGSILPNHNSALIDLASIEYLEGNHPGCLEHFSEWSSSQYQFIKDAFTFASEEQKLRYAGKYSPVSNRFLSAALESQDESFLRASLRMVLHGKGLVLESLLEQQRFTTCSNNPELSKKIARHSTLCSSIASATMTGIGRQDINARREHLKSLYETKNTLEAEISQMCDEFNQRGLREFEISDIAASLPKGSMLWEFIKYRPYAFEKMGTGEEWSPDRYLAFTLNAEGSITVVDLGQAGLIDSIIGEYRYALQDAPKFIYDGRESSAVAELTSITATLYDLLFEPLADQLAGENRIFISPDGQLNLVNFDILPCPDDTYVIEKFQISYLFSGRSLPMQEENRESPDMYAMIMVNPDYFSMPDYQDDEILALSYSDSRENAVTRGTSVGSGCLADLFQPLPATASEGTIISSILSAEFPGRVKSYNSETASEYTLKNIQSPPRVLHLATHGYYCPSESFDGSSGFVNNPQLYSGLALAGANQVILGKYDQDSAREDGILTSLEASGLNLNGADLVILSACQSGVGQVINGEGVYSLQRAFQQAGARAVIISIMDIPDESTKELMGHFYGNWLSGSSKSNALRQASLSILNDRRQEYGCAHPLFWGGFILVGDPD